MMLFHEKRSSVLDAGVQNFFSALVTLIDAVAVNRLAPAHVHRMN